MSATSIPFNPSAIRFEPRSKRLDVFDPAMCCSSGVCGPEVDPMLVQFASDIAWLKSQGIPVQRHNLSQDAAAFVANPLVRDLLTERGEAALPLVLSGGKVVVAGRYPDRPELAALFGFSPTADPTAEESSCCRGSSCC